MTESTWTNEERRRSADHLRKLADEVDPDLPAMEAESAGAVLDDIKAAAEPAFGNIAAAAGGALSVVTALADNLERVRDHQAEAGQRFRDIQQLVDTTGMGYGDARAFLNFARTFDAPVSTLAAFFDDVMKLTSGAADEATQRRALALHDLGLLVVDIKNGGTAAVTTLLMRLAQAGPDDVAKLVSRGHDQTDLQELIALAQPFAQAGGFAGIRQMYSK